MKLTRLEILEIAKRHCMEYVHEAQLMRFTEDIILAEAEKNKVEGWHQTWMPDTENPWKDDA